MLGARTAERLAACAERIDPAGGWTAWRVTDIGDEAQCAAPAGLAEERFGGADAVVHVAALDAHFGGLDDADFAGWQQVVDVNLFGMLRMTRACLPSMRARGGGSVVMIGTQSSAAATSEAR